MASRFIMSHKMMSMCLLDENFYSVVPVFRVVQKAANREWELRKKSINQGGKKGCSSCGKRRAAKSRADLEKRHGALFSQHVSTMDDRKKQLAPLHTYIRDHYTRLTGKEGEPTFNLIVMYIPVKKDGVIKAEAMEV